MVGYGSSFNARAIHLPHVPRAYISGTEQLQRICQLASTITADFGSTNMEGFKSTYFTVFSGRAEYLLGIGVPVNDAFHIATSSVFSDPFHRSQLRLHGYHCLADAKLLCEEIGLYQFILDWSASNDVRRSAGNACQRGTNS